MKRLLFVIIAALALPGTAAAGNAAHPKLDAAAATISGDPTLKTYCEDDQAEWDGWLASESLPPGAEVRGFTFQANPDPLTGGHYVYIDRKACTLLRLFVDGVPPKFHNEFPFEDAGGAILTLTHESMHQRLHSNDEALVECNAMKFLPWVIQTVFGTPATFRQAYDVRIRVKRHGKWVCVWRTRIHRVPNEDYAALMTGAILLDASTPAQYHGATC